MHGLLCREEGAAPEPHLGLETGSEREADAGPSVPGGEADGAVLPGARAASARRACRLGRACGALARRCNMLSFFMHTIKKHAPYLVYMHMYQHNVPLGGLIRGRFLN